MIIAVAKFLRGSVFALDSIKRYMRFVKPYKMLLFLTIVIGILKFAIPLFLPWLLQIIIDDILLKDGMTTEEKTKQLFTWIELHLYCFLLFVHQSNITANTLHKT